MRPVDMLGFSHINPGDVCNASDVRKSKLFGFYTKRTRRRTSAGSVASFHVRPCEGIVKLTSLSIQALLTVAYSLPDITSNDELIQGQTHSMMTPPTTPLYKRHRFPAEIISHCVWLYFRFSLSSRAL
jgi:hypothetical protein